MNLKSVAQAFWFQFFPAILLGSTTIVLLCMGIIPIYYLCYTFIMWVLVCGLGIAVGYHRVFAHRTHKLPQWKENIILFFAVFAGQGASIFWVAMHRCALLHLNSQFTCRMKNLYSTHRSHTVYAT